MAQTITVSDLVPATPAEIYAAWLDSMAHAAMTGGGKAQASPEVGAEHSAWDGYISGMNLALYPGQRIEQSWRSTDFAPGDADSTLTVLLDPADGGTKVTLVHANVPDDQLGYEQGWRDWYLEPMKAYFSALVAPAVEPVMKPAAKAPARKTAAGKKAAAGKATATKRAAAKRPAAAKKAAAAKKPAAKRAAGKKPTAKKAAARKPGGRKSAAKKPAARKATRKPVAKKTGARKTGARKTGRKARR